MDTLSRRSLLRVLLVGAGTVAFPVISSPARATPAAGAGPTRLRRAVFMPHTGTTFRLVAGRRSRRAVLRSVTDLEAGDAGQESRFSLLFHVRGAMPEGIYDVGNAMLRPVPLFLTPVGQKPGWYEAVVNS